MDDDDSSTHLRICHLSQLVDGLNIYNILEPCYHAPEKIRNINIELPSSFRSLGETERPLAVRKRMFGRAWPLRAPVRPGIVPSWSQLLDDVEVPCTVSSVPWFFWIFMVPPSCFPSLLLEFMVSVIDL